MPQSTAYIPTSQAAIDLMRLLQRASMTENPSERSGFALDAARAYWKLGYGTLASRVVQNILRLDSTDFNATLWGWHFARRLGQVEISRRYVKRLREIDVTASINETVGIIESQSDSIGLARNASGKSRHALEVAKKYLELDLVDEAIDESERAVGFDDASIEAWLFLGHLYELRGGLPAAIAAYRKAADIDPGNTAAANKVAEFQRRFPD